MSADLSREIATGRISDFGDKDTEHIARFLEHSGAPAMAALVRQRWADQEELRAAVKFAAWLCQQPKPQMEVAVRYFDRILRPSLPGRPAPAR